MAGKIHDEQLKLDIIINGNDAQKKLGDLETQQRKISDQTKELSNAKKALDSSVRESNASLIQTNKILKSNTSTLKSNIQRQGLLSIKIENLEEKQEGLLATKQKLIESGKTESRQFDLISKKILKNTEEVSKSKNERISLIETQGVLSKSISNSTNKVSGLNDVIEKNKIESKLLKQEISSLKEVTEKNKIAHKEYREELGIGVMSTTQLSRESRRLKTIMGRLTPHTEKWEEYNVELKKVDGRLAEVGREMKDVKKTLNDDQAFSAAQESFSNIITGIKTGDLVALKSGFKGLWRGIKTVTKAALTFIATPLGLALTAIAGISLGVKEWVNFNLEVEKSNQLIRDITRTTGESTNAIRSRAEALQEVFGTDFQESIETAKALVKNFGISYDDAFDLIEDGSIRGKNKNAEFVESLKEYPIQFKNAGFSAKEFVSIVNTGIDLSIYKDKLPDAIKEADLALKEQTKATRDALVNAFGSSFSEKILIKIKKGEITTKQALQEISKQSQKVNLNQQQQAKLTADLFKGAGEDAGGSLKIFKALNIALNEQQKPLTAAQKLRKEELATKQELKEITTQLFANSSEGMGKMIKLGKIWVNKILIGFLKGSVDLYNWFIDLNNESAVFSAALSGIGNSATVSFRVLGILISNAWQSFKSLGTIIQGVFTGDMSKIKEGFKKGIQFVPNVLNEIKDQIKNDANDIFDSIQGKNKKKRITLKTLVSTEVDDKDKGKNTQTATEIAAKQKAFKKGEEELGNFILAQKQQQLLNQKFGLEKELAQIDAKYQKEIEKAQKHHLNTTELEGVRDAEKKELILLRQQELNERLKTQEEENLLEKEALRLEREAEKAETDEEKALLLLERTQWIANEQLRIEEEKELARLRLAGATEEEIALIKKKFALKKAKVEAIFDKGKVAADKQTKKNEDVVNKQRWDATYELFGNLSTLLGKHTAAGKAAAIAQATMNTYQGITEVWAAKSVLPQPFGTAAKIVSTATVLASGLGAVKNITSTKVPGYEDGLYPVTRNDGKQFNAKLGTTKTGLVTAPTLMDGNYLAGERSTPRNPEMIIDDVTFSKLDPNVVSYITNVHNGTVSGYENGKYNQTNTVDSVSFNEESETKTTTSLTTEAIELLRRIAESSEKGTTLVFGYEDAQKIFDLQEENNSSKQNGNYGS